METGFNPFNKVVRKILNGLFKPPVLKPDVIRQGTEALMGASGINQEQAKTCLYYSVATYLLPDKLDTFPILAVIGAPGTGKSSLLTQLGKMVKEPKPIDAETASMLRDELDHTVTALIDEGDNLNESYLVKRYSKQTSEISYKVEAERGWRPQRANIFGATIIVRRIPFRDIATKSRAIAINTRYKPGNYYITENLDKEEIMKLAERAKLNLDVSERVKNNWMPLQAIALSVGDEDWLKSAEEQIKRDVASLMSMQGFNPSQAVIIVLRQEMLQQNVTMDVPLSKIREQLKWHFDLKLRNQQIQQICQDLGFKVVATDNYPKVKANAELLKNLLKEHALEA
jgi:AAA15 family ATPase/GTPase